MSELSDAIEERDAAREAYLNALKNGSSYSVSTGPGSRSRSYYDIDTLRKIYEAAEAKVKRLEGRSGPKIGVIRHG